MSIIRYIRKRYNLFLVTLRKFRNDLMIKTMRREYKGPVSNNVTMNASILKKGDDIFGKLKNQIFTHLSLDMTGSASKKNLTGKERAMLFLSKLAAPKKRQREIRVYRDKETKKVTVVNRVKEVK